MQITGTLQLHQKMQTTTRIDLLLEMLAKSHHALMLHLEEMEAIIADDGVPHAATAVASWNLCIANFERRKSVKALHDHLIGSATPEDAQELAAALQDHEMEALVLADHVSTWTRDTVASDWLGYCAAQSRLCCQVRNRLRQDALLFLPIVQRELRRSS